MPRYQVLALWLVLSSISVASQPNILWIITDDQSNDLGAYGTPAVSTPRMDQLAAEGVRYENAYTTAPVCSASRTAMMTGVYQTSLPLAMHHRPANASKQPLPTDIQPVTEYLRDAGYYVGNAKPDFSGNGKLDMNFANPDGSQLAFSDLFDGNDWRQAGSQPWFMQVNIFEPHRSFRLANTDLSRRDQLVLPGDMPDHPLARADYADYLASIESADAKVGAVLDRLAADGLADNTIVFFFGDNGREFTRAKGSAYDPGYRVPLIARIPETLRDGRPDLSPGVVENGLVNMLDVTAASLSAAGVDLTNPTLSHLHGEDLLASDFDGREAVVMANDRSGNAGHRSRVVRRDNLTYIRNIHSDLGYFGTDANWYSKQERPVHTLHEVMKARGLVTAADNLIYGDSRPEEELYDLATDPYQLNNLIDDPTHQESLQTLRGDLDSWTQTTGDLGGQLDPDLQPALNWYRNTGQYRHLDEKNLPRDTTDYEYLQWWAELFDVPLNLEEGEFDRNSFWIPNNSFENISLSDGGYQGGVPQGWTDATPGGIWVQNLRTNQMTNPSAHGTNSLQLNSGGAEVRWAIDDNWGNLLEADEAAAWQFDFSAAVGRRSDSQGDDAGLLRVSLQNVAGEILADTAFDLQAVAQGDFLYQTFQLLVDRNLAADYAGETLYLALANLASVSSDTRNARVVLDQLSLSITPFDAADFNYDGAVDQSDLQVWSNALGTDGNLDADGNLDGQVSGADFLIWQRSRSAGSAVVAVPEPTTTILSWFACVLIISLRIA